LYFPSTNFKVFCFCLKRKHKKETAGSLEKLGSGFISQDPKRDVDSLKGRGVCVCKRRERERERERE
jgi:hypothetical protein